MRPFLVGLGLLLCLSTIVGAQPTPASPATPEQQRGVRRVPEGRPCEIYLGGGGALQPRQAKNLCGNYAGLPAVITKVQCVTTQGSLVFRPQLSGGTATSILAYPLVCTPEEQVGVLNGQPRIQSFAKNLTDCLGSCRVDFIVESVNGATEATLTVVYEYE